MKTANGNTVIHIMKTQLEILHPDSGDILYDIGVFPAHFAPNLNVVLLGEKYFLEKFILKVDYSNQVFSLKLHPQKQ